MRGKDVVPTTQEIEAKAWGNPPHWEGIITSPGKKASRKRKGRRRKRGMSNIFGFF
jgi:hypothetical protein